MSVLVRHKETNSNSERAGKVNIALKKWAILPELTHACVSLFAPSPIFLVHSHVNRGQEMRGFSHSTWNLAFCVATAQAAATEARGEIEFSWNSPVSLALGWTVLDRTGLDLVQGASQGSLFGPSSWVLEDVGLGNLKLSQGALPFLDCH